MLTRIKNEGMTIDSVIERAKDKNDPFHIVRSRTEPQPDLISGVRLLRTAVFLRFVAK